MLFQVLFDLSHFLLEGSFSLAELVDEVPDQVYIVAHHDTSNQRVEDDEDFLSRCYGNDVSVADR